jgi:hypothetical protein
MFETPTYYDPIIPCPEGPFAFTDAAIFMLFYPL